MNQIFEIIEKLRSIKLFHDFNVLQLLAVLVLVYIIGTLASRFMRKEREKGYYISVVCKKCGWEGNVSKFKRICANCHSDQVK